MRDALKFVQGAVAKKDFQPALTHFRIADGRVMGYNGTIALSSPINLDIVAMPKAVPFVKAIDRCEDSTTAINLTEAGYLSIKSGKFRARIECSADSEILSGIVPQGDPLPIGPLLDATNTLLPFVGTDASRPWAMGILLRGHSAFATNNIILAEYWIGTPMPNINLPVSAMEELNRIGEEPIGVRLSTNAITFYFKDDRWMRSQLLSSDWPELDPLFEKAFTDATLVDIPEELYTVVDNLKPFVGIEGRIFFREDKIMTAPHDAVGASYEFLQGLPPTGAYNHKHLLSLQGRAKKIDFTKHPLPCPFIGDRLRGVFIGMIDE